MTAPLLTLKTPRKPRWNLWNRKRVYRNLDSLYETVKTYMEQLQPLWNHNSLTTSMDDSLYGKITASMAPRQPLWNRASM